MRYIILICMGLFVIKTKAQAYADILETDSLPSRIVFYLPTADNDKLNLIKNELVKYPQIQSAVYYRGTHQALLIEFGEVVLPKFFIYADIKKQLAQGIKHEDIFIKTPTSYDLIKNDVGNDLTNFILK